ncbi:hypothetical protein O181_022771 [Austropuccinia psidii MF-1]|uniref:OTU domain-containing protein n=1 Tax=Austropuccinia psidii MF-1 TaxID=1389203 RepID=A0A9Q3GX07_9BASI|nr:hypothetical protein [Austropuccinia psidii MF-1]
MVKNNHKSVKRRSNKNSPNLNESNPPRRLKGRAKTRSSDAKVLQATDDDEKRLKDQLNKMGLYPVNILGDGNCLFRALSDQLYGTPDRHLQVRSEVCQYLAQNESRYKAFVDTDEEESWETHLKEMSKQGTYGGHLELSACANLHRRPIKIVQPGMIYVISHEDESPSNSRNHKDKNKKSSISYSPSFSQSSSSARPLYLVYHQWEHYSSVRNLDGPHCGLPNVQPRPTHGQNDFKHNLTKLSSQEGLIEENEQEASEDQEIGSNLSPTGPTDNQQSASNQPSSEQLNSTNYREGSATSAESVHASSTPPPNFASSQISQPSLSSKLPGKHRVSHTNFVTQDGGKISKKEARRARRREARRQETKANSGIDCHNQPSSNPCATSQDGMETASMLKELKV